MTNRSKHTHTGNSNKIEDEDMEHHMKLYMALMETKFHQLKAKRIQLEQLLHNSASKIQRLFRRFSLKKTTRAALTIQRCWRRALNRRK